MFVIIQSAKDKNTEHGDLVKDLSTNAKVKLPVKSSRARQCGVNNQRLVPIRNFS